MRSNGRWKTGVEGDAKKRELGDSGRLKKDGKEIKCITLKYNDNISFHT